MPAFPAGRLHTRATTHRHPTPRSLDPFFILFTTTVNSSTTPIPTTVNLTPAIAMVKTLSSPGVHLVDCYAFFIVFYGCFSLGTARPFCPGYAGRGARWARCALPTSINHQPRSCRCTFGCRGWARGTALRLFIELGGCVMGDAHRCCVWLEGNVGIFGWARACLIQRWWPREMGTAHAWLNHWSWGSIYARSEQ